MRKNPIKPRQADPISLALLEARDQSKTKGCVKGNIFVIPKQPGLAYPLGTGAGSRMAVVITIIQEIIVIGKMGPCFGFLFHPSQRGGRSVVLPWRYSFGSHVLLGFCILVLHSGKNNFCHFNISICCLKPQLWPSIVREERIQLLWVPKAGKIS